MYNIENVKNIIKRDNAVLLGEYKKVTRNILIHFICSCNTEVFKNPHSFMYVSGAFCKKCTRKNAIIKTRKTFMEKYGVEHVFQNETIKNKAKQTLIERYGVEYTLNHPEFKNKAKNTTLSRFGTEYASQAQQFKDQIKQSCLERYGVECVLNAPQVRNKIKQTNLERYGVENAAQSPEIMEKTQKNAKKYKEYTLPTGKVIKVQGYEPFALDYLVKHYNEEDIKTDRKDIPRITYTANDKTRYYFPDIYIPSENKIIEVKSTWTYKCKQDNIQEKAEATRQAGYAYEIWIYTANGEKISEEAFKDNLKPTQTPA